MKGSALLAMAAALLLISPLSAHAADSGWSGTFDGFGNTTWAGQWGVQTGDGHNWGWEQMQSVSDADKGAVLQVSYGAGSSAHSCEDCPSPGGGQFYTSFTDSGHPELSSAQVLTLRYSVKFDAGFDFGRGGKLPGLFGGAPGGESGGNHDGSAFSTRFMWRDHPTTGAGEVYWYSPTGTGYGDDLGLGNWTWQGDGQWHSVQQQVDRGSGSVTVSYDGQQVFTTSGLDGLNNIPFTGVFFSTFFGGHDTSWGPGHDETAKFADFSVTAS